MALFAIYGRHEIDQCPWNNKERAKEVVEMANVDLASILPKYKIHNIVGQYHSGLEHTFVWLFDAEEAHQIQKFEVDVGMAMLNEVKIVPITEFKDVVAGAKKIHGL